MLIELRAENFRSLRDEQVLTMESSLVGNASDPRARTVPGSAEKLSCVSAIYGANASGKSNVLAAMAFMREAIRESNRYWEPEQLIPREPFAWGSRHDEPSEFVVQLLLDGFRYEYGFLVTDQTIQEEWLHAWPNGKKQIWFERDGKRFKFGDKFKGNNEVIRDITRPNSLFFSTAIQLKHEQLAPIYRWFLAIRTFGAAFDRTSDFRLETQLYSLLGKQKDSQRSEQDRLFELASFKSLLRKVDVGIDDIKIDERDADKKVDPKNRLRFVLKHQTKSKNSWLPLDEESHGTQTLIRIAFPLLYALRKGTMILVDELESSLHPELASKLVRMFNDPETNPRNAQLLFTTHDTNLLGNTVGEPALRRDQVWLTEKDAEGATVLYPLTDYKPRKAENLERGYLQGRYGAIPYLGNFTLNGGDSR